MKQPRDKKGRFTAIDAELKAIDVIRREFEPFDVETRKRMWRWIRNRMGIYV